MELTVNPEFHSLIPSVSSEEYQLLEENLLKEGCREAIVTWNDCILDGHNRYEICQKHNIGFKILEKEFDSEDEAKIWIIRNQLARRNLPPRERARLALLLKPAIEKKAKEKQKESGGAVSSKSSKPPIHTRAEVARIAGVSESTVQNVETSAKQVSKTDKQSKKKEKAKNKATELKTKKLEKSKTLGKLKYYWSIADDDERREFKQWIKKEGN
jgi:hypothetical protein